jgi:hypothetical protein
VSKGKALVIFGTVSAVLSAVFFGLEQTAPATIPEGRLFSPKDWYEVLGASTAIASFGLLLPGGIVWSSGWSRLEEARAMRAAGFSLAPVPAGSLAGASLRWTF